MAVCSDREKVKRAVRISVCFLNTEYATVILLICTYLRKKLCKGYMTLHQDILVHWLCIHWHKISLLQFSK